MTIKVQLVGPMTGLPNFNYDTFDAVEQHIRDNGLCIEATSGIAAFGVEPVNPANSFGRRQDLPRHRYLASSLKQVGMADAICLLPGWADSEGARLEVAYALELGCMDFYLAWRTFPELGWATGPLSRSAVEAVLAVRTLATGGMTINQARAEQGFEPFQFPEADMPVVMETRRGPVFIEPSAARAEPEWPAPPAGTSWSDHEVTDLGGFVVKDSGTRQEYASGMRRDTQDGKPDYTLIDRAFLKRWAMHMVKGKAKYGEDNWRLASSEEELKRFQKSALRHLIQWLDGEDEEDHAAAVAFNVAAA
jgi:hypothetical protein